MLQSIDYLKRAVEANASDLFVVAGAPVKQKINGVILPVDEERLMPKETQELITQIYEMAKRPMESFRESGDDDFSFAVPGLARFRVNAFRQRGSLATVIRVVAFDIPSWEKLRIPESVVRLADLSHGMVIVAGTAGSGKSTTQACIIDRINHSRSCHIVTLEDPIEYLHRNVKSIVSQREISTDTADYSVALRACLRQSPDVILLGELRDYETIHTAITAAETGHLVIATLHTVNAVNTVDRIIDTFPPSQQNQIRIQLSAVLHTVVSQQFLPGINGEQIPAFEIMHMNSAVRTLIRDCKTHQIDNIIASGTEEGMISMDQYIHRLWKDGTISQQTALDYAVQPQQMRRRMGL